MTPAQFLARIKKGTVPPVTLLLGPEAYERAAHQGRAAGHVPPDAVSQHDLADLTLAEVLDDARALSLFACERLIWVVNAEPAMPRGKAAAEDDDGDGPATAGGGDAAPLAAYMKDPTPGRHAGFRGHPLRFRRRGQAQAGSRAQVLCGDRRRGGVAALLARWTRATRRRR